MFFETVTTSSILSETVIISPIFFPTIANPLKIELSNIARVGKIFNVFLTSPYKLYNSTWFSVFLTLKLSSLTLISETLLVIVIENSIVRFNN